MSDDNVIDMGKARRDALGDPAEGDEPHAEMTLTPGQFLAAELKRLGMTRAQLADALNVNWPTIDRWTRDEGFTRKNRIAAAHAMKLQDDHFDRPDATGQHQHLCEATLASFLADPLVARDITDAELAALRSQQVPLDRKPTPQFYMALLFLLRGLSSETSPKTPEPRTR